MAVEIAVRISHPNPQLNLKRRLERVAKNNLGICGTRVSGIGEDYIELYGPSKFNLGSPDILRLLKSKFPGEKIMIGRIDNDPRITRSRTALDKLIEDQQRIAELKAALNTLLKEKQPIGPLALLGPGVGLDRILKDEAQKAEVILLAIELMELG